MSLPQEQQRIFSQKPEGMILDVYKQYMHTVNDFIEKNREAIAEIKEAPNDKDFRRNFIDYLDKDGRLLRRETPQKNSIMLEEFDESGNVHGMAAFFFPDRYSIKSYDHGKEDKCKRIGIGNARNHYLSSVDYSIHQKTEGPVIEKKYEDGLQRFQYDGYHVVNKVYYWDNRPVPRNVYNLYNNCRDLMNGDWDNLFRSLSGKNKKTDEQLIKEARSLSLD